VNVIEVALPSVNAAQGVARALTPGRKFVMPAHDDRRASQMAPARTVTVWVTHSCSSLAAEVVERLRGLDFDVRLWNRNVMAPSDSHGAMVTETARPGPDFTEQPMRTRSPSIGQPVAVKTRRHAVRQVD
jgi:hypothetical protein